jgi:eukaryotic-like serine/threonine-protein kinase
MIGQRLGSFLIEAKVGSGAMGVVYRAVNEKTGKIAAVKIVTAEASARAGTNERFQREADILQQFRHPNIVRFLAVGRYQGTDYFAMEFIKGQTLDQVLERKGAMDWREVLKLGIQVCDALHYAHERGVVHRDLKPSNLLVTTQGLVKLTDFGIAKDLDATALTATGRTLGTAAYMAPEQIRGTPEVSHKTDLYALGCLLYQMVTGALPFQGKAVAVLMNMHMTQQPPRPSSKAGDVPLSLEHVIVGPEMDEAGAISKRSRQDKLGLVVDGRNRPLYLMAKDPTQRPHDAQAVGEILRTLLKAAERPEAVPMVYGGDGLPTRLGAAPGPAAPPADSMIAGATSAPTQGAKAKRSSRKKTVESSPGPPEWLAPAGMVVALVVLSGIMLYFLWPPSAKYMIRQAEPQMASKEFGQWKLAEGEYFDAIESKIKDPGHPYRKQVNEWRDKIGLEQARRRAEVLEKPNLARFSKPNPDLRTEVEFLHYHNLAAASLDGGSYEAAAKSWDELANLLKSDDRQERPWVLLARERAAGLRKEIKAERDQLERLLIEADAYARTGRTEEAKRIREDAARRYWHKHDLRQLLNAHGAVPNNDAPDSSAEPAESKP